MRNLLLALLLPAAAGGATPGAVSGRVSDPLTGGRIEGARVTADGAAAETFTDSAGAYRLPGVPAGEARVRFFHTGYAEEVRRVTVPPGGEAALDAELAPRHGGAAAVKLDSFVVEAKQIGAVAASMRVRLDRAVSVIPLGIAMGLVAEKVGVRVTAKGKKDVLWRPGATRDQ